MAKLKPTMQWLVPLCFAIPTTAAMFVLALPLGERATFGWFAFVPLLRCLRGRGFLPALGASLAAIFCAAWISSTGLLYATCSLVESPQWVYTGFGIFGFTVSIAVGAWGDKASQKLPAWWFAGLATLLEAFLLLQLPSHLALTQYRNVVVLQFAALGGVWLVSFLLWWSNFALAKLPLPRLVIALCVIVPCSLLISQIRFETPGKRALVGAIQLAEPNTDSLRLMMHEASADHPDFVVWPELSGIPFTFGGDPKKLLALSAEPGMAPFDTSYSDDYRPLPHNASALFSNGNMSAIYWKRKVFGSESKMHIPGERAVDAPYRDGELGLNVCFDSCYPEIIRDTAKLPGVDLIALPSIDPLAANYFVSAIHASFTPFRCAEEGVSMVKADGYAYSMFVDPYGQIVAELPPGDQHRSARVPIEMHWTPYKQFGDWFLYLIGVAVGARLIVNVRRKQAKVGSKPVP